MAERLLLLITKARIAAMAARSSSGAPLAALDTGLQGPLEEVLAGEQQPPLLMAPRAGWAG